MIQGILRMIDITSGTISIDGQDLAALPRDTIRQRLSCLTQEPFLFANTVRFNMDPTSEYEDEDIVRALERVHLWTVIADEIESPSVLDAEMGETLLSHGQRQLFCLGRALLKRSQYLILDEPTSKYVEVLTTSFNLRIMH